MLLQCKYINAFACMTYLCKIVCVGHIWLRLPETDMQTAHILHKYVNNTYVLTYFTFAVRFAVNAYLFKYFKYVKGIANTYVYGAVHASHHQKCIAEIGRPILALFLIPLVKMILLVVQIKLSDRFWLGQNWGSYKFKVIMDFADGRLITIRRSLPN